MTAHETPTFILERDVEMAALDHYSGDGGGEQGRLAASLEERWQTLRARYRAEAMKEVHRNFVGTHTLDGRPFGEWLSAEASR